MILIFIGLFLFLFFLTTIVAKIIYRDATGLSICIIGLALAGAYLICELLLHLHL